MMRQPRQHADKHLDFVRSLPCLVCGNDIESQAAHIRYADDRVAKRYVGKGEKPDDKFTVPLCDKDHRHQHSMNEREYWEKAGIDAVFVALALWSVTGNYELGTQIIHRAQER